MREAAQSQQVEQGFTGSRGDDGLQLDHQPADGDDDGTQSRRDPQHVDVAGPHTAVDSVADQ